MFHVKRLIFVFLALPLISIGQHMGSTTLELKTLPIHTMSDVALLNNINGYTESAALNATQKEWFYWTNYSRSDPRRFWDSIIQPLLKAYPNLKNSYSVSLKKELYSTPSLPLLKPNAKLAAAALSLAEALAEKKASPSHTSPSGATFDDRMKSISIQKCAGENISFGPPNTVLMLVLLYIDEGVPDLGHRKSLLNPSFVEMGIGVGNYPEGKKLVVQDFSCEQQ